MSPLECSTFVPYGTFTIDDNEEVSFKRFDDGKEHYVQTNPLLKPLRIIGLPSGGGYIEGRYYEPNKKSLARGLYIKST